MDKYLKPNSAYERLWEEYNKYKSLIVAVYFDDDLTKLVENVRKN